MSGGERIYRGSARVESIDPDNRGFRYGDGLFETMRGHRGSVPWWPAHWRRLSAGAARLQLPLPREELVLGEIAAMLDGGDGVVRLQLTRGGGGRGYAPASAAEPAWVLSRHGVPPAPPDGALRLRWCTTRLAQQPLLAGLKHCNRLEQVLARLELRDGGEDEGLVLGEGDEVVSAISANVFILRGDHWWTPPVDRCGVAGVCRAWLLGQGLAGERRLDREAVGEADAVVLTNAVRGILPVSRLGTRRWPPHPRVGALRAALAAAHPAFADS